MQHDYLSSRRRSKITCLRRRSKWRNGKEDKSPTCLVCSAILRLLLPLLFLTLPIRRQSCNDRGDEHDSEDVVVSAHHLDDIRTTGFPKIVAQLGCIDCMPVCCMFNLARVGYYSHAVCSKTDIISLLKC